ncbi:universal stress protein [Marinobacter halophilus]|uniref:Universal stress protein UspA n=1 Tax=Marinobacter halophilus TaxID=1323740 RepID=A0A2T1KJX4_9GAMM|nr:universal stress protein [Marinobacter halophilus]PSF10375.1 universal stress protein UspA [Marinobacter halophilus]GGC70187.1 universal stress protein E [Marinobacter halophilus]
MTKFLIIMDPKHKHQTALGRGIELARATGADLEVVAFVHEYLDALPADPAVQTTAKQALIEHRQQWLEQMLALADCGDLKINAYTVWEKHIHQWVSARCQQDTINAVVKTGNRSETFLYTPTDWHLVRECPAPIMLVAANKWNKAHPILAAVDLSSDKPVKKALNNRIIDQAWHLANVMSTDLHLVHALHTSVVLADLDIIDPIAQARKREESLKPKIEHLCHTWQIKPEHVHIVSGPAQKVIPSVANKIKADMVVIGTTGKTGLAAKVIGNTAEKVLTHLRTDLLAVKPAE